MRLGDVFGYRLQQAFNRDRLYQIALSARAHRHLNGILIHLARVKNNRRP